MGHKLLVVDLTESQSCADVVDTAGDFIIAAWMRRQEPLEVGDAMAAKEILEANGYKFGLQYILRKVEDS